MKRHLAAFSSPSFALISVLALVSLAALTATAFLASARLERQATRSLGETARLEMACASARACAGQSLNVMAQKSLQILPTYWRGTNATDWTNELGYLLIGYPNAANVQWAYTCGFNPAIHKKLDTTVFKIEGINTNPGSYLSEIGSFMATLTNGFVTNPTSTNTNCTLIPLLGGRTSPPVGWTYIYQDKKIANSTNTTNVPVARFSYYMEDLCGLIDAERMGGTNRTTGTNASEISLTNLTTNWSSNSIINAGNYNQFINPTNRAKYFTPGMMLYAGGLSTNDLRYFAHGLLSYNDFPNTIPMGIAISNSKGYANATTTNPKVNLNSSANLNVGTIAAAINANLPGFTNRAGGLTNVTNGYSFDYAKCLAANIVDYIDTDSTPTYGSSGTTRYCGIELAPVVTCAALVSARDTATYSPPLVASNLPPPTTYTVTEKLTATLNLQFWNPYDKATPATNVPLEFRTCPTGTESSDGLAYIVAGDNATPLSGNGFYKHFETLFPSFQSTTIKIPAIPPNSYALVDVASTATFTWANPCGAKITASQYEGMQVSSKLWKPTYVSNNETTRQVKLTKGNISYSKKPSSWKLSSYYSGSDGKPLVNNTWNGYLKIGINGSLCTLTNLYINSGGLEDDNANRTCWYPNLRVFAGSITTGTTSDSTNCVGTGDPRISYFARSSNNQPLYNSSPWNKDGAAPVTYASGLSWGGRAIVRALPSTGDAVKTSQIRTTDSVFSSASLATDPTTWLDSGHADNPFGTNSPYVANANADNPSAPTYSSASNLFSKISPKQWRTNQAPCTIKNSALTNICELGNIFDPIMWKRESQSVLGINNSSNTPSTYHGGGNTLRIGRAEHPRFAFTNLGGAYPVPNMGQSAAALLDLFSLSNSYDNGGRINLNTAPAPVLRALAGGVTLTNDPSMKPFTNLAVPTQMAEAFAQGVMRYRATYPFLSPSQLAFIATDYGTTNGANHWTNTWPKNAVFGNTNSTISLTNAPGNPSSWTTASNGVTEWNDQAAEEWFSKIYNLSTVQSWNFRIYVVAQLVGTNGLPTGPSMRKYSLMYIRYTNTNPVAAGPYISFESPY
jgi:hypothetical protein